MNSSAISLTNSPGARQLGLPNIAFVGKAGAGKSSAAAFVCEEFRYRRLSFADPLKDIASQLWGEGARTDRDKLQRLGMAVRDIDSDAWCNALLAGLRDDRRFQQFQTPVSAAIPYVNDDCRFENEWYALKGAGFVFVRVTAPVTQRVDRLRAIDKLQDESQLNHISETAINHLKADYEIENDSHVYDLQDAIVDVLIKARRRR